MKIETDEIYIVNLDDKDERHVFTEREEAAELLAEEMEDAQKKFKKAIEGEEVEGPTTFSLKIPSDLLEEDWKYGPIKVQSILASKFLSEV